MLYISGLGPTVSELDVSQLPVFPKTRFSMMVPEVLEHIQKMPGFKIKLFLNVNIRTICFMNAFEMACSGKLSEFCNP